ncbi:Autoinducer 2 import ATP-binding protein LsrA [Cupriavidus laharis]|uniref:Autoinducer 2 import ATP-binding protein LsrA n=1 Tax=Cupriavidus laharis TaxID=151654 RepID=A0ABM8XR92_9BURK|nr:ATP-binding cassette domain-containing protein [Cupriavidus laharis]CAG9182825.1 Autoinducer 2 import ATP-binding protein LsrA [Cupriavidus laharis]
MKPDIIVATHVLNLQLDGRAVLDNVRLAVSRGRVTALVGPAGAGKSALLGVLSGNLSPCGGSVEIEGRNVAGMSPHVLNRLGVQYIGPPGPEQGARTVRECIALGAQWHVRGHHAALAQADEVARRLGLEFHLHKAAASLQPALRKRLALASAVARRAHLLLLDGILAGLSASERAWMVATIRDLRADGMTVLMAERIMPCVAKVADDVLVLEDGKLIAQGLPHAVSRDPAVFGAYAGNRPDPGRAARGPAHA